MKVISKEDKVNAINNKWSNSCINKSWFIFCFAEKSQSWATFVAVFLKAVIFVVINRNLYLTFHVFIMTDFDLAAEPPTFF